MKTEQPTIHIHYPPDKLRCTGCRICSDTCPRKAIQMIVDKHGYYYPQIDDSLCIHCGYCEKVCPICRIPRPLNSVHEAYSGKHINPAVVNRSASGGAFQAIIDAWKPDLVCGVKWGQNFTAINEICPSNSAEQFSKPKYVLSDTNSIFCHTENAIKKGKRVLFSGTPCQIAALRNHIDTCDNLLLVDIVCHGVTSDFLFRKHIEELESKLGKHVVSWEFHDKTPVNGVKNIRSAKVVFDDGTWEHYESAQDAFLKLYYRRVAYRDSCGVCAFAKPERLSDITICDAHHVDELYPEISIHEGASTILIHSEKGKEILSQLEKNMYLHKMDYDWIVAHNEQLSEPTAIHPGTKFFYKLIDAGVSFDKAVKIVTYRGICVRAAGRLKRILERTV